MLVLSAQGTFSFPSVLTIRESIGKEAWCEWGFEDGAGLGWDEKERGILRRRGSMAKDLDQEGGCCVCFRGLFQCIKQISAQTPWPPFCGAP